MIFSRRAVLKSVLGAVSPAVASQAATGSSKTVSGDVRQPNAAPLADSIVELHQPDGRMLDTKTDLRGHYDFRQVASAGPYMLTFREGQGSTVLHVVKQLSANAEQTVSVTVDPNIKSFDAVYEALQALEVLSAFVRANPEVLRGPHQQQLGQIPQALNSLRQRFVGTANQMTFLKEKAESVARLANLPL